MLAAAVKEFLYAQKRRVGSQARIRISGQQELARLGTNENQVLAKQANSALTEVEEMVKEKKSFELVMKRMRRTITKQDGELWPLIMESLYYGYLQIETDLREHLKESVAERPVWTEWGCRVKGLGALSMAGMLGLFESAHYEGEDWSRWGTPARMFGFAGLNTKDGQAVKRQKGRKVSFCIELRSFLIGRVGPNLLRGNGGYKERYDLYKARKKAEKEAHGIEIVPTSKLPERDGKYYEPEGKMSEGHLHAMAVRWMVKLLVSHLWEMIQKLELGVENPRTPFAIEHLDGHTTKIDPIFDTEGVTRYPASRSKKTKGKGKGKDKGKDKGKTVAA